ncbi:MAG: Gfo/Idh/MocA family oxidoreductase, partial [Propionibacterium sp.]|nr:Gfo/Idh/MocA family oxidoreductase [Propionibacterium sp.]
MTLRVGIIGGGIRGQLFAETLQTRDDVTVAGMADPAQERLGWAEGIAKFPDHDTLLAGADLDAVIVATPDFAHFDPVAAAARRGLPILVEK